MVVKEKAKQKTERNPEYTRQVLLEAAFKEIYLKGFQSASLDNILSTTGVTKGALYHHFPNKLALGYAVVDEIIFNMINEKWAPIGNCRNPIDFIKEAVQVICTEMSQEDVTLGCPLNNLMQEMSPIDEGFRNRLQKVYNWWSATVADALGKGEKQGTVRKDMDIDKTAVFIVASIEGCVGAAKNAQSIELFRACMDEFVKYLDCLRPNVWWKKITG
jgi:AcrR family transcriptional regulator